MVGFFKFIALSLATSTVVLGESAEKRALLPALLGNVDLAVSACPDVVLNGPGGGGCGQQRGPSPTGAPAPPLPQAPMTSYSNAQPPATKSGSSSRMPAPSSSTSKPASSSRMPAPSSSTTKPASSSRMPAPSMPASSAPAPSMPAPAPWTPAPAPPAPAPSSTCSM
ncbi:hypothetical protein GGH14_006653 [Coemansia sp. RSA 370]|nr:hypothetical protein GGH14_006653 [Coemansia sp. RSA 370]KAJ2727932.1 hypothetical protein H4S00_001268 [Coemansia sp. D1744]